MSTLFVVATPIGNLSDLTPRAAQTLREADLILAEDTRVAATLLSHLGTKGKTVTRYDEHVHRKALAIALEALREGKNVALTTDAGTPGISDPGARLVAAIRREAPKVSIIPIPGPSAVTALLSVSGFPADQFYFAGFPPHKKGRERFFRDLAARSETVVLYESPHRILKTLDELLAVYGAPREVVVGRELTKIYETIMAGPLGAVTEKLKNGSIKGEFVIVVSSK